MVFAEAEPVVPVGPTAPDDDPASRRSSLCCISTICVRTSSSVVGVVVARGTGGVLLAWPAGREVEAAVAAGRASAAMNDCASGGAEMPRIARIVRGDASPPYV